MYEGNAGRTATVLNDKSSRPNVIISDRRDTAFEDNRLRQLLMREEINVYTAKDGAEMLKNNCSSGEYHLMIIRDGGINAPAFSEIESVRSMSDLPILTVSDNCTEIYRIMALSKGADACMDASELGAFEFKARIVAMLRRYTGAGTDTAPTHRTALENTIVNGELTLDRRRRELFSNGSRIRMTSIEYGIVEYLMVNCGNVCTVNDIYRQVWQGTPYSVRKTVVEHIRRIRRKLETDPHNPRYIKVVFGVGYKMEKMA